MHLPRLPFKFGPARNGEGAPRAAGRRSAFGQDPAAAGVSGALLLSLLLASAALLVLSKLEHTLVRLMRAAIADALVRPLALAHQASAPLRLVLREAGTYSGMAVEIDRLKRANAELRAEMWRSRAAELRIEQLGKLANAVSEREPPRLAARVVAEARGPFARTLLLHAGREHGVRPGYPVVGTEGLLGRVIEAREHASRVLLLTDYASRVPVQIGAKGVRAIVVGDGGARPRLAYLPADASVAAGDDVSTSGEGGLLPRGLRIGVVVGSDRDWRVTLQAGEAGIDYVSILRLDTPEGVAWQDDLPLPSGQRSLRRAAAMRAAGIEEERPR